MRIYISGAITGTNDYPLRFASAEQKLEQMGHEVINPAKMNSVLPVLTHAEYMKLDFTLMSLCDAVCLLPNSEESKGVAMELEYADKHKIPVIAL
jgi:hypothetical protein